MATTIDMTHVGEEHTQAEWEELMKALNEARAHDKRLKVHKSVFWYFLEVLRPRWMNGSQVIFAEGADDPTLFTSWDREYFCQRFGDYEVLSRLLKLERMLQRYE